MLISFVNGHESLSLNSRFIIGFVDLRNTLVHFNALIIFHHRITSQNMKMKMEVQVVLLLATNFNFINKLSRAKRMVNKIINLVFINFLNM